MAERQDVLKVLAILSSVYVRDMAAITPEQKTQMATTWFSMLKDIPADILSGAAECHVKTSKWMPTIAELRKQAIASIDEFGAETAGLAFSTIINEIQNGRKRHELISPVAREALRAVGGWGDVGRSTEVKFLRIEYVKVYRELREVETRRNLTLDFKEILSRVGAMKCLT